MIRDTVFGPVNGLPGGEFSSGDIVPFDRVDIVPYETIYTRNFGKSITMGIPHGSTGSYAWTGPPRHYADVSADGHAIAFIVRNSSGIENGGTGKVDITFYITVIDDDGHLLYTKELIYPSQNATQAQSLAGAASCKFDKHNGLLVLIHGSSGGSSDLYYYDIQGEGGKFQSDTGIGGELISGTSISYSPTKDRFVVGGVAYRITNKNILEYTSSRTTSNFQYVNPLWLFGGDYILVNDNSEHILMHYATKTKAIIPLESMRYYGSLGEVDGNKYFMMDGTNMYAVEITAEPTFTQKIVKTFSQPTLTGIPWGDLRKNNDQYWVVATLTSGSGTASTLIDVNYSVAPQWIENISGAVSSKGLSRPLGLHSDKIVHIRDASGSVYVNIAKNGVYLK